MKNLFLLLMIFPLIFAKRIIEIENGKIEGEENENFYAFKGIRYATAERFEIATANQEKWDGVKEFKNFGHVCAQYLHFSYDFIGDENCLNLNVYVPKTVIESEEKAPVLFFIHGGAFMFGEGDDYEPENVMEPGKMILVTVNYRLGILGFLSTEDEVLPGNLGLKDQVEALKWIQRNIQAFNGDPKKVTTVGFSAGGASVHLHYMSKLSNGLFNNGISHSGVATNPWVIIENAQENAHKLAELANCPFDDHRKMLKCLKQKPVRALILLTKNFQPFLYNPFSPFAPVVEPQNKYAFITEHPMESLRKGSFNQRPWLMSQTKDEGSYPSAEFYGDEKHLKEINDRWDELAPFILQFDGLSKNDKLKKRLSRLIRKFYMQDKEISRENFQSFNDMLSDALFKSHAKTSFEAQSKYSSSYMYYFNFKGLYGLGEMLANADLGISHGEDMCLIYNLARTVSLSADEKKMTKSLIEMYYSFATTDVPVFNGLRIAKSSPEELKYLKITSNDDFENVNFHETFGMSTFWDYVETKLQKPVNTKIDPELEIDPPRPSLSILKDLPKNTQIKFDDEL